MIDFLLPIITNPFFGVASGIIGFFAGCVFMIYKDKRKEFNAAADKLAEILHRGRAGEIPLVECEDFSRFLSGPALEDYNETLKKYKEACQRPAKTFTGPIDLRRKDPPPMKDSEAAQSLFMELRRFVRRK